MNRSTIFLTLLTLTTFALADEPQFKPIKLPKPPLQTELIEALDQAIEDAGDEADAGLFNKRAHQFTYGGEWKKAAADLRRSIDRDPSKINVWMQTGVVLLLAGDRMSYQQLVEKLLKYHKDNTNMYSREKRAKMCVLPRAPVSEQKTVEAFAKQAANESEDSPWAPYFTATHALVCYRYGKYEDAHKAIAETDRRNALKDRPSQDVYAMGRLIEAMCHAKQGDTEKATASFNKADKTLRERLTSKELALNSDYWHDWLICKLLHDESCAVLTTDETQPEKKGK